MQLETPRLLLRPYTETDIATLHQLWTHPEVRRYLWDDIIIPPERAAEVIRSSMEEWEIYGFGQWCVCDAASQQLIGFCGFRHDEPGMPPELLYGLHPDWWGRGLATEAAAAAVMFGFCQKNFSTVWAAAHPDNQQSLALLERLGMKFQQRRLLHGLDMLCYQLPKQTWLQHHRC
ncbi:MAG: GNAT family N-acetyltransferase [Armatimonadetes bacterium]|nr:GNAT family N-acetyltransferase [Armatimonadota bacterium]